jgi:2',3'-cyclic-nucleotide 2'-phosphodiesterase (5'-nucleotidase family)
MIDAMNLLNTDAVGVAARDLRYGASFLRTQLKRRSLQVVCANLIDKRSGKPLFDPYVIKKIGGVKVGFFGLIGEKADLGPSRDSLLIEEPLVVARRTVGDMRKRGAHVVVLLAQLGKIESEDLVAAIDGVNAVVIGSGAPIMEKGRTIKNTVACYGGEQGYYLCETVLTLDARRQVTNGVADAVMLGPSVRERGEIQTVVKRFEDGASEKARKADAERAARAVGQGGGTMTQP